MRDEYIVNNNIKLNGEIIIPSDKSISHRSVIIGALTKGRIHIKNYSLGGDCRASLNIIRNLGCEFNFLSENEFILDAVNCFKKPHNSLDCCNSGTAMRLMSGILAGQKFESELIGDDSLSKRPMKRVIEPLEQMGAKILSNSNRAPLKFTPSEIHSIDYVSKIASAQVKSCVLLSGLSACDNNYTSVTEPYLSRNHTELMLKYFGADIKTEQIKSGFKISVKKTDLIPKDIEIPGDISSAAFFLAAGAIVPNSDILIKNVGINETRSGIIDVLIQMGADIELLNKREISGESVADIRVRYSPDLKGINIKGDIIPRLIDELPIIAVMASQADGETIVSDAADLRNKECDRIKAIVQGLSALGVEIKEYEDGFKIYGKTQLKGECTLETYCDHRLVMSFFVAGLISKKPITIKDYSWVNISFPEFLNLMIKLGYSK